MIKFIENGCDNIKFNMRMFTFLSIIIMIFILISSVSATDIDNVTGISASNDDKSVKVENDLNELGTSSDDNQTQALASSDDKSLNADNTQEILSDDAGTWSNLTSEIGTGGDKVLSKKNYTYDSGSTITITTAGVIDGNGAVIDMAGSNIQAFKVNIDGVTFKNLTIKNANFNDACSAIYFSNSGTLTNCNFINNTETNNNWDYAANGGAVYFGGSGSVDNCNFISNNALSWSNAAAIYFVTSGTVRNSNFTNNKVESGLGGAIFFGSSASVDNCNFINNTGIGASSGAAVYFASSGNVTNCNFTNNTATNWGGAVYFGDSSSVDNCIFIYNRIISEDNGGAINFNANGTVTNCIFYKNSASRSGGAVFIGGSGIVDNCNFTDNHGDSVSYYGGALYITDGNVTNCNFINSYVCSWGGAVYIALSGNVINCNFTNNTSVDHDTGAGAGGAVYVGSSATVNNCNFIDNHGGQQGGAVWTNNGIVTNCIFNGNTAEDGAVYFDSSGTVTNCYFINNDAATHGGAVYGFGTVTYCSFVNNSANSQGGAVYGEGTIKYCSFDNNYGSEGGVIYFKSSGSAEYCNFTNNSATNGGVIYFYHSATVTNCNFTANTASGNGSAIYIKKSATVTNCNFVGNKASQNGGAINLNSGTVTNCNFTNNTAGNGGAVNLNGGTVTNCNFTNNTAPNGGALCGSGTATNCKFANNKATADYSYGGAIFFDYGTVTNCNFINNEATTDGGAIHFTNSGTALNCNFTGNTAEKGGAIHFDNSGIVRNCNFTGNIASDGGAVYFKADGTVSNCNFISNTADYGGAVFQDSGYMLHCNFISNAATNNGGAVYFNEEGIMIDCNFSGNNASTGSAMYLDSSSSLQIFDSVFLNNKANLADNDPLNVTINANNIEIIFTGQDNLINAIYSEGDVNFANVNYWGVNGITNTDDSYPSKSTKEAGQNITVGVVINDSLVLNEVKVTDENGAIVISITVEGNYFVIVRHDDDSYYPEAEMKFINMDFYVNVTSQTTNNRTVNITAKSNIYGGIMTDKVKFILSNGDKINANYTDNGTWWAIYKFGKYSNYKVNASYSELSNVAINNATVNITKVNSTIDLDDFNVDYGTSNITIKTEGATVISAKINDKVMFINKYTILLSGLDAGEYTLTVTTIPDEDHNSVNKTVKMTVNKIDSTLTVNNITLDYGSSTNIIVTTGGVTGIIADIDGTNVTVNDNTITIPVLDAGTHILTVTAIGDVNHNNVTKNATITVNKLKTVLAASAVTATYNVNKYLVITLKDANGNPLGGVKVTVNLNGAKTYTTGKDGKVIVPTKGLAAKTYSAKITFAGNTNYYGSAKNVKVTVKKATPKMTAKKKTFKAKTKIKKYTIILKDNVKKAMKKVKVTLKVKGKTYNAKTNKKGKATFKIKNLNKKGKYKAVIKYKGNKNYKKVTKKVKLTVKAR